MSEKAANFNKFLIVPNDKPEEIVGFVQVKTDKAMLPTDSLIPVIIADKIEHFLLVKKAEQPPPLSPTEAKGNSFVTKLRRLFSRRH